MNWQQIMYNSICFKWKKNVLRETVVLLLLMLKLRKHLGAF
jgi:hypothetical protein